MICRNEPKKAQRWQDSQIRGFCAELEQPENPAELQDEGRP